MWNADPLVFSSVFFLTFSSLDEQIGVLLTVTRAGKQLLSSRCPSEWFSPLKKLTVIPRAGSCFGTSAGGGRHVARTPLVQPFVQAASAGVHEEVADSVQFQTQLLWDGYLHLFGRTPVLLKDGQKCSPLQVCENQPRFLWCIAPVFARVQLFSFACFGGFVC